MATELETKPWTYQVWEEAALLPSQGNFANAGGGGGGYNGSQQLSPGYYDVRTNTHYSSYEHFCRCNNMHPGSIRYTGEIIAVKVSKKKLLLTKLKRK